MESPNKTQDRTKVTEPKKAFVAPLLDQHEKLARITFDVSTGGSLDTGCGGPNQLPC